VRVRERRQNNQANAKDKQNILTICGLLVLCILLLYAPITLDQVKSTLLGGIIGGLLTFLNNSQPAQESGGNVNTGSVERMTVEQPVDAGGTQELKGGV
jgi:hypothetical protein